MAQSTYLTEEQIRHCWYFVGNNIDSFGQPVADNFSSILKLVRHVEEHTENRLKVTTQVAVSKPDPIVEVKPRKKPGPAKGWYAAKKAAEAAAQAEANKNV